MNNPIKSELNEWISVEDRLPKENERVLIPTTEGVFCGWYVPAKPDGIDSMGTDAGFMSMDWVVHPSRSFGNPNDRHEAENQPTHWMPLPTPPKELNKD